MQNLRHLGSKLNHSALIKRIIEKPRSLLFKSSFLITSKTAPKMLTSISSIISAKQKDRVFLVGSGPSLWGFNFDILADEDTICVNSSVFDVPQPNFFITKDYSFLLKYLIPCLQAKSNAVKIWNSAMKIFVACYAEGNLQDIDNEIVDVSHGIRYDLCPVNWVIKNHEQWGIGLSLADFRCGVDSGYGALQLAILLGYKNIYFLGYDMCVQGETHYHSRYKKRKSEEFQKKLDGYANLYIQAFQEIKNMNQVKLYSCSSTSKFNSYIEYLPVEEVLK